MHVEEKPVQLYKHCRNPRCAGNQQVAIDGVRVETQWMFKDNGGDFPGVERSMTTFRAADVEDCDCGECGKPCEVTDQARPQYAPESGHDPLYLARADAKPFSAQRQQEVQNTRVTELEGELSEIRGQMAALIEAVKGEKAA